MGAWVAQSVLTDTDVPVSAVALDDEGGFRRPAEQLRQALSRRAPERTALAQIPGLEHALADEPGLEPAPQTARAARVDAAVTAWLGRHLNGRQRPAKVTGTAGLGRSG
jgi:hypothetical protein